MSQPFAAARGVRAAARQKCSVATPPPPHPSTRLCCRAERCRSDGHGVTSAAAMQPAASRLGAVQQQQQQQQQPPQQQQPWQCAAAAVAAVPLLLLPPSPSSWAAALPAMQDPDSNLNYLTNTEIDQRRKDAHFVRAYDGHVSLQNKVTQSWTDIKCDLKVPGLLLFRDAAGEVSYLSYAGLQQVDLSDDQVVAAIAKDSWEAGTTAVQTVVEGGGVAPLQLTREGFYTLVSISSSDDFEAAAPKPSVGAARGR